MKNKQSQLSEEWQVYYTIANLPYFNRGLKNSILQFLQEHYHIKALDFLQYSEKQLQELGFPGELMDLFFAARNQRGSFLKDLDELNSSDVEMILSTSVLYPNKLRERLSGKHLPPILYCKGNSALLSKKISAIVSSQKSTPQKHLQTQALLSNIQNKDMALLCGVGSETDKIAFEFAMQHHLPLLILLPRGILASGYLPYELRSPKIPDNILLMSFFPIHQKSNENNELVRLKLMHSIAELSYIIDIRRESLSWTAAIQALAENRNLYIIDNNRSTDTLVSLYIRGAGIIDTNLNFRYKGKFITLLNAFLSNQKASLGKIRKHFELTISPAFLRKDLEALPDIFTEKIGERTYYRTRTEELNQLTLFD